MYDAPLTLTHSKVPAGLTISCQYVLYVASVPLPLPGEKKKMELDFYLPSPATRATGRRSFQ